MNTDRHAVPTIPSGTLNLLLTVLGVLFACSVLFSSVAKQQRLPDELEKALELQLQKINGDILDES